MEFVLDLMMLMSGEISMLTSLRNLAGMSSGPVALLGFRCWRRFCTPSVLMVIFFISGVGLIPRSGRLSMSSSVKTEANCWLRMFAFVQVPAVFFLIILFN